MLASLLLLGLLFAPSLVHAHEVYVLAPSVVAQAIAQPSFSEIDVMLANINQFVFWGFVATLVIFVVFFVSISRTLERVLDPFLAKLPRYAPVIGRITIGLSFLAAAYYGALFGPELPLIPTFGAYAPIVAGLLSLIGIALILGMYTRIAAIVALTLFAIEIYVHGWYILTYANYAGELIALLILGAHALGVHHRGTDKVSAPRWLYTLKQKAAPLAFPIVRIAFGVSLIYASVFAKIIHDNLALAVTAAYPAIVTFFGFEPHFLVLGAAIIEVLIGTFFILGIEIRFTALFVLFWLSLSLWYFGEAVWPHIVLIGIPIAFIFYGYDRFSLEGWLFKRDGREPVL